MGAFERPRALGAGLTICLWMLAPALLAATPAETARATHGGVRLSFAPYAKISARRAETMRLVREAKFEAAEALLAAPQEAYERGKVDELAAATAFAPFSTSDESLGPQLDRWVEKSPGSYSARLARARYLRAAFYRFRRVQRAGSEAAIGMDRVRDIAARSITDYRAALERNPRLMIAYADLVELAVATGDGALFGDVTRKALAQAPSTWLVRDAISRSGAVRPEQRAAFLADAAKHARENPLLLQLPAEVELRKANELWVRGDLEAALAIYDEQVRTLDVFAIRKNRARLLRLLERFPEASAEIERAIALMPGKYDGYRERGWLHYDQKHWAQAAADFRRGLEIDPLDDDLNRGLGQALEASGDTAGAVAALERAARWGLDAELYSEVGSLQLAKANNPKAALAALDRAVALDPQNKWAWYRRGEALVALRAPGATASFERFLALADESSAEDREFIVSVRKWIAASKSIPAPPPASAEP